MAHILRCVVVFASLVLMPSAAAAQPMETEIPGVTAELLELRVSNGVLRLAIRFVNTTAAATAPVGIKFSDIVLIDSKAKTKTLGFTDPAGRYVGGPITDWGDGGRWWPKLPPKGEAIFWMYFPPVPAGTVLTVQMPKAFPFENVKVTEGTGTVTSAQKAVSTPAGFTASLVSAQREGQELRVRMRLEPSAGAAGRVLDADVLMADVFAFDPVGKRKFTLIKDTDGNFMAQPTTDKGNGGRLFLNTVSATRLMAFTFLAPPADVAAVDIIIPKFVPFEGVKLAGTGQAGAAEGAAISGRSVGFEGALKALNARTTGSEIAIDLAADVLFDFDKAELKQAAADSLQSLLTVTNAKAGSSINIEGHTDNRGEAAYNQALSERRANAVRDWLVANGIAGPRVSARGAGESRPLKAGATEADHQANRRVEIRIQTR